MLKTLLKLMVVTGLAAGLGLGWAYHHYVVANPGEELERAYIMGVIAQESPVFFRDGTTRVGVFFEDEHRDFVPFDALPRAYVASIVAAEDDGFWSHPGFDVVHILGALWLDLRAGEMVAGGSTLTQQTAKNIYYRPDRSLRSKLTEALYALRLEAHYSKADILEFYVNQFHVAGNGRGIGIAARHFFDADVTELGLVECAFLAGLVKAPSRYDPFVGDEAHRQEAVDAAVTRTRYVLRQIAGEDPERLAGPLPARGDAEAAVAYAGRVREVQDLQAQARGLLEQGFTIPFERGVFRYDASAVLDEVGRRLAEPPFADVLKAAGIDDPAKAGLSIITTLDPDAQRAALYGLWHHLTDVGTMLEGLGTDALVRPPSEAPRFDPDDMPVAWSFRTAVVKGSHEVKGKRVLDVDLGGHPCVVDRDGLVRLANAIARGHSGSPSTKATTAEIDAMIDALPAGTVTWVSVREATAGAALCDLEVRPKLQGASVVLRDGQVLAMVGGNDNRNFNRATALRQMGSAWKPLIYNAALQLGWSTDDALDNRRNVFPFSTTVYWPSADHQGPASTSLAWAGAKSENLASVWLLYHLTDRLDPAAVAELAKTLGLARGEGEDADTYRLRIQRDGILPTPSRVHESIFIQSRQEVLATLPQSAHPEDETALITMSYGWGFEAERRKSLSADQQRSLDRAWTLVRPRRAACGEAYQAFVSALDMGVVPMPHGDTPITVRRAADGRYDLACGVTPPGFALPDADMLPAPRGGLLGLFGGPQTVPVCAESDLWIDGELHVATVDALASAVDRRELALEVTGEDGVDLYAPEQLYGHQDFRVLLGVKYVAALARRYGVRTEIREVLSIPLGASELTLEEAAMVYEGITTGATWAFPGDAVGRPVDEPAASTLLIQEIRDVDGNVLYRALPKRVEVTTPDVAALTADVLRHVVTDGTGARAKDAIQLGGAPLPVAGKTGTTNDYRNVAFVGYAPVVHGGMPDGQLTLGVYVGYDDNTAMSRKSIRLAGASGALPAWVTAARGLASFGLLGELSQEAPAGGWIFADPPELVRVPVSPDTGLPSGPVPDGAAVTGVPMLLVRAAVEPAVPEVVDDLGPAHPVRIAPSTTRQPDADRAGPRDVWAPFRKWGKKDRNPDAP